MGFIDSVKNIVETPIDWVEEGFDWTKDLGGAVEDSVEDTVSAGWEGTKDVFSTGWNDVEWFFGGLLAWIKDIVMIYAMAQPFLSISALKIIAEII